MCCHGLSSDQSWGGWVRPLVSGGIQDRGSRVLLFLYLARILAQDRLVECLRVSYGQRGLFFGQNWRWIRRFLRWNVEVNWVRLNRCVTLAMPFGLGIEVVNACQ